MFNNSTDKDGIVVQRRINMMWDFFRRKCMACKLRQNGLQYRPERLLQGKQMLYKMAVWILTSMFIGSQTSYSYAHSTKEPPNSNMM